MVDIPDPLGLNLGLNYGEEALSGSRERRERREFVGKRQPKREE